MSPEFVDPLKVTNRQGADGSALRGLLTGSAFLVCGGPSAKTLPLDQLQARGLFSLAVNNMAGHFRPNAFVCGDPPVKFHHGIWLDPAVMKFIPFPKLTRGPDRWALREKRGGSFQPLQRAGRDVRTIDCPNVWGFDRRSWMRPDDSFFTDPAAAWGNHKEGALKLGEPTTVCTMLLGLRLLSWLGARTVYLVGVDFEMRAERQANYAFGQSRTGTAVRSNNSQFRMVSGWLQLMQRRGVFDRFGLRILNCNPASALTAFPHVPFTDALAESLREFPAEPFDLADWYN